MNILAIGLENYRIEEISPGHDEAVCNIIKAVGAEYGAIGEGFGPSDPEVLNMSQHYRPQCRSLYLVAMLGDIVVGGSGIAPFNHCDDVCELRKLFLLPESRGVGLGRELTLKCLDFAKSQGYKQCYLDTLSSMKAAIALYEKLGFKYLDNPLDGTVHTGCDVWMLKDL